MRSRQKSEAIDRNPLEKGDRQLFEERLLDDPRLTGPHVAMLRAMLGEFHRGRADCFPSIAQITKKTHYPERSVQRYMSELIELEIYYRVIDRSVWPTQRRFLLVSHPNTPAILAELEGNPHVEIFGGGYARKVPKPSAQMRLTLVGGGVPKTVGGGVPKTVGGGVPDLRAPLFEAVTVETGSVKPVPQRVEDPPGQNGNGTAPGTIAGPPRPAPVQACVPAPVPTPGPRKLTGP